MASTPVGLKDQTDSNHRQFIAVCDNYKKIDDAIAQVCSPVELIDQTNSDKCQCSAVCDNYKEINDVAS